LQAPGSFSSLDLVIGLYQFVILLFSLSVHESAHAWMASRMGDQTARLEGRISLNPARHIDPMGTFLYPALMIFGPLFGFTWFGGGGIILGWGKPVPVTTRNLKKITRDDNIITCAGPAANLLLAILGFLLLILLILAVPGGRDAVGITIQGQILLDGLSAPQAVALLAWFLVQINLGLIFFNLVPIPPLDASRFVRNILPYNALGTFDSIARFSFILIFFFGRIVVSILLGPALRLVLAALTPLVFRAH
jgi:Zn-dependent protease